MTTTPTPADDEREATLSEDVGLLVAQASAVAFAYDVDAGLIPPDVARALFPHELAAHTNFAAVDAQIDATGEAVRQVMADLRDAYAAALIAELEAADDPLAVVDAIASPETTTRVSGLTELLAIATRDATDELLIAYQAGFRQVRDEARAQGVTPAAMTAFADPSAVGGEAGAEIGAGEVKDAAEALRDLTAKSKRVAGETVDAVNAAVIRRAAVLDPYTPMALEALAEAARDVTAGAPLADAAGLAGGAQNAGRLAGMDSVDAAREVYASEVLDRRTCGPCQAVDGTTYASPGEAAGDYPSGYKGCEGGVRCRGTLVAVWGDEALPSGTEPPEPPPPAAIPEPEPEPPAGPDPTLVALVPGGKLSYSQARAKALRDELTEAGYEDLVTAVTDWQFEDTAGVIRETRSGGTRGDALLDAVRAGPEADLELYRGLAVADSKADVLASYAPGVEYEIGAASFSSKLNTASTFGESVRAASKTKKTRVLIDLLPGAKALPIEKLSATRALANEREWVTGGTLRVVQSYESDGWIIVQVRQVAAP